VSLLQRTAELVDVPSVSREEGRLADLVEAELRQHERLDVSRVDDNVVARTDLGRPMRLVLAGHLDTVPPNGNATAHVDGDVLWGVGSADMKGGLAVMLELARNLKRPAVDVSWIFYTGEEIEAVHNGLGHLFRDRPDLVAGDVAILGEPTGGAIEAGCQGTMRFRLTLTGRRAHTARAWKGRNAVHRAGEVLARLSRYQPRRPVLDGCEFREAMQAVGIEGGVSGNVVPDRVTISVNVRYAPDRTAGDAEAELRRLLEGAIGSEDELRVIDAAEAAPPGLDHPMLVALRQRNGLDVRAKLGWTDVARFAAAGIPATNFGPGDAMLAHTAEEHVDRASLEEVYAALKDLLEVGAG
jgi:succinyl-diaminopimelate desuccinylase